ncbi:MAG: class A beta-lactamase-related serine hydrolase [Candidatus Margulisbacteria bacterium]|nr:class A beta-lactamase-related serine hydrolase [Candidatus Margulisiibacteriota bacterium]
MYEPDPSPPVPLSQWERGVSFWLAGEGLWRIVCINLALLLLCSVSYAALSPAKLSLMQQKAAQITQPYGYKVGVYFIDLKTGQSFGINAENKFPAASVAKVPVMATVFHLAELKELPLNKKIVFKEKDKVGGSGVLQWLKGNREYTVWNLTRLMIVLSDNTATRILCDTVGLERINEYMAILGLTGTKLTDHTMLNEYPELRINVTTPKDMARLVQMIKEASHFSKDSSKQMLSFMRSQRYRWGIWRGVPKGVMVADKTGNLDGVLNDVGVVYSPAGNYVLSVFTHQISKKHTARKLINNISKTIYEVYQK